MWLAVKQIIALIVSLLTTVFPSSEFLAGFEALELATKEDNCRLNASIVSDVHIDVDCLSANGFGLTVLTTLNAQKIQSMHLSFRATSPTTATLLQWKAFSKLWRTVPAPKTGLSQWVTMT